MNMYLKKKKKEIKMANKHIKKTAQALQQLKICNPKCVHLQAKDQRCEIETDKTEKRITEIHCFIEEFNTSHQLLVNQIGRNSIRTQFTKRTQSINLV